MNTQNILTRVKLKHTKGAKMAYLYNFEILKSLNLNPSEFDPSETLLNVGDSITFKDQKFKILDVDLINELTTFVQIAGKMNNVKLQATAGAFDDLVMAAALTQEASKWRSTVFFAEDAMFDEGTAYDPDTGFPIY